ncbi:phosphate ABC transporter substrate-binding protein [Bacteroidota bacterium]
MKKTTKLYTFLTILAIAIVGAAFTPAPKKITVKGSDTMVILSQKWAEVFMKSHPDIIIQVTGGGSGTGIAALINGATDICNASRPMKKSEIERVKQKYNTNGIEIPCAKDGITVYLNKANGINALSVQQLADIFSGRVTNWKQVGGKDAPIKLYGRENSSGTYVFFQEEVVKGDYAPSCQTLPGTAAVVNAVMKDPNGIGYGGAAYAEGIKICKVKKDADSPGYEANAENIKKGLYPISRYLYMYTATRPTGEIKEFIDWILSPAGQQMVTEVGYFPVR